MVTPSVSLVVPVRGGGEGYRRCLRALGALHPPPEEILVVADGDERAAAVAREAGFAVILNAINLGDAASRNIGARASRGDLLLFVDADVEVRPDVVGQIRRFFAEHPRYAAVFGSYDDEPAERDFFSQYRNLLHHYVHQTGAAEASTFFNALGAIRRDVFFALGQFYEPNVRVGISDIELGYRLKEAGYRVRLEKGLQAKHLKRWPWPLMVRTDIFGRGALWTEMLLQRRGRAVDDLNLKLSTRACVALTPLGLGALAVTPRWPFAGVAGAAALAVVAALGLPEWRFFREKRGLVFAFKALAWHYVYYLCCLAGAVVGTSRFLLGCPVYRRSGVKVAERRG